MVYADTPRVARLIFEKLVLFVLHKSALAGILLNLKMLTMEINYWTGSFLSRKFPSSMVASRETVISSSQQKTVLLQSLSSRLHLRQLLKYLHHRYCIGFTDLDPTKFILFFYNNNTVCYEWSQAGTTFIWDITVLGWDVNYKEEFVPTDECSYTIIVQKQKKLSSIEGPIRNTFRTNEPGKIVLTIENCSNKKKKVFYRNKVKKSAF